MKYRRAHARRSALWVVFSLCALLMVPGGVAAMDQATPDPSGTATTPPSEESASDFPDLAAYPGVKQAVARSYMADFEAIQAAASPASTSTDATPADGEILPEFRDLGVMLMLGYVIEFDTATSAESAFPGLVEDFDTSSQIEIGSENTKFMRVPVEGVGQEAQGFSLTVTADMFGSDSFLIVARQENLIFSVYGMSLNGEVKSGTIAFATKLASGTIGSDAPKFDWDGASTGGIWDVFPPKGDASLGGLVPVSDGQIYPNPAE
jgi:hypothetical protein